MIAVGRIAGIYGVRGWLRVESWTRPIDNLLQYGQWSLIAAQSQLSTPSQTVELLEGRRQGRGLVASVAGPDGSPLENRDEAAKWVGARIEVERAEFPPAPGGSWYWADLVGLEVQNLRAEVLGRVESLMDNGAQDVMVVVEDKRRRLIPFVTGVVVQSVDLDAARLVVDWAADY